AEFIGLRLVAGEKNWLGAEVRDDFGNVRASQEITVICVGRPQGIVIQPEQKEFPADGTSLLKIEAWVVDQGGYRVNYPGFLTVETTSGELVGQDADPGESGFQVACVDGVARFYLRAPLQPGEATIVVGYDQLQETRKIFFAPHLRNLFLVGLGEITVGHGQKSGDTEFLRKERWFRENWYAGGRGAFFLKGKVSQDILLTASYDSHKESTPDYFNHRLINTESDELYPIYGDESRLGFEALSREKLYVRLDRNRSYLMYGDIRTDFSDTVLTAFTRTLTGIKTEVKTKKVQVKAFASRTDQTQKMEAIPGRGISGYYYLSGVPVVEGSELVVIETRDRRQTERVLKREGRVRGTDYVVDYDSGGILFKEPVPSHDSDFNPVFIVVSYETSGGQSHYLYGTRALVKVQPWIEVGLTAIREENEISDYLLSGADLTLRLPGKTVLKAEWARSRSLFEEAGVLAPKSDGGWMVNLESHPTEKLSLLAHYRETGTWFGNLSAIDAMRGMRKYSLDVAYLLNNSLTLRGRTLQEDDTLNQMKHRYAGLGLEKKSGPTSFLIEFYHETARGTYVAPPDPNSRFPFDIREDIPERSTAVRFRVERQLSSDFSLSLEHRQNFLSTEDVISQFGVDYRLEKNRKLYLRQQYGQYAGRTEMRTALGVEAEVFRNTVAFNEYRLSDGLDGGRNQQAIGLRNRFLLGPDITGDIRIENLTTVSGRERQEQPDGLAVATGVEYLPADNLKLTGRLEYRHQSSEDTYLGEVGAAYRLKSDLYGLFRQRFFLDNMDSGQRRTGRTLLGLAYRPLEDDRFNGLLRLEFKNDKDTMTDSGYRGNAYIISAEVNYQTSAQTQWSGKYAGKLSLESGFTHYTDLISGRVLRDITDRFDFALEARLLRSRLAHSLMVGGSMEVGYRLIKNVWLSLGYSFDDFDTDLVGDSYQGKGPYLKIRFKFDESIVKALPGRQ
ncbi:MAG TPA: hypothetical protein PKW42_05580, partial [bacterium]|nr:hypothetical protein [bacterium]